MNKPEKLETEREVIHLWQYAAEYGYFNDNVKILNIEVSPSMMVDLSDCLPRLDGDFVYHYGPYRLHFQVSNKVGTYLIQD